MTHPGALVSYSHTQGFIYINSILKYFILNHLLQKKEICDTNAKLITPSLTANLIFTKMLYPIFVLMNEQHSSTHSFKSTDCPISLDK